jgi:beta-glucanase (GH16 family)
MYQDSQLWPQMNALACAGGAACVTRLSNGRSFSDDYHVFAVEWEADEMRYT